MFNTAIPGVPAGVVCVFLTAGLVCSLLNGSFASVLSWRSATLKNNVKILLNDKEFTGLAQAVYSHSLAHPFSDGTARGAAQQSTKLYRSVAIRQRGDRLGEDRRRYGPG